MGKYGIFFCLLLLDFENPMSTSTKLPALASVAKLARTPASDLKKLGWRGLMNTVRIKGKLLIANHDSPEAVIVSVAEYDAMMQIVEQSQAQVESSLAGLRKSFDERMSVLQDRSAATRLRSTIRGRAKLDRKVKAGFGY